MCLPFTRKLALPGNFSQCEAHPLDVGFLFILMLPSRLDVFPGYARILGYALFPVHPVRTIFLFTRLATIARLPGKDVSPGYAKQQRSRPARLTRITRLPGKHKLPGYPVTTNFDEIAPCEVPDPRCCELPGAKSQVPEILEPGPRCHIPGARS